MTQLALSFDEVPLTCEVQARYHSIAGCLAGKKTPVQVAAELSLGYSTVTRWLREFRQQGMAGLFQATLSAREPYTPERVIVQLLFFKCCAPRVGDRELARVLYSTTGRLLHHQTVKSLCERYFFWRYDEFQRQIRYPVPDDPQALRLEIVRLEHVGWTEVRIAELLRLNRKTVRKWLRRARQHAHTLAPSAEVEQLWLLDLPRAPHHRERKVYFGVIHATLELQKKYGHAGWFRIKSYLERDYQIYLSPTTIKKVMALNRRLHLAPQRPVKVAKVRDPREGPPHSQRAFEHVYCDIRYLDAKPEGVQLYSTLLLEGFSRTILAGSLTVEQDVGVVLHLYYQALVRWGLWEQIISDHGGQFQSHAFARVNQRLRIKHEMYEKGHPWQNLIESQFGIQARVGEYYWQRCRSVEAAQEFHRELIRDHNRLTHFAHHKRADKKHAPLEVLGQARGRAVEASDLHQAFGRKFWQRKTDKRGFVRLGRWKIYVEEALPRTVVEVRYWEGKLRAEYETHLLSEYDCQWNKAKLQPEAIEKRRQYPHPFESRQVTLFDPQWVREAVDLGRPSPQQERRLVPRAQQLRLYLGPELVKRSG